jgi:hypothetical protein
MQKEASGKVIITHGQMGPEKCPLIWISYNLWIFIHKK